MPTLIDLQSRFIDYLTGESNSLESSVVDQGNVSIEVRLNIYKNAYHIRLSQALETDHEILGLYLGDELFDRMAADFIDNYPSTYTSLRHFGNQLPEFLQAVETFNQYPVISELALFERRLLDVFDASEADRIPFSTLQKIPPEDWPDITFRFHPSTELFVSGWNCVEIWKALKDKRTPPTAINDDNGHWLLWRGIDRLSEFRKLEEDEFAILSLGLEGHSFASMCESLLQWHKEEQAGMMSLQYLSTWFEQGIIIATVVD